MRHPFILILLLLLLSPGPLAAQSWTWQELPSMPEPVANNAVEAGISNDTLCVYSFTGIDSTKIWSGIHLKSFKYNTLSEQWTQLEDVPDVLGKIAAGATNIQDKIYLAGGYYVFQMEGRRAQMICMFLILKPIPGWKTPHQFLPP